MWLQVGSWLDCCCQGAERGQLELQQFYRKWVAFSLTEEEQQKAQKIFFPPADKIIWLFLEEDLD